MRGIKEIDDFKNQYSEYIDVDELDIGDVCFCNMCYECANNKKRCKICGGDTYLIKMRWRENIK